MAALIKKRYLLVAIVLIVIFLIAMSISEAAFNPLSVFKKTSTSDKSTTKNTATTATRNSQAVPPSAQKTSAQQQSSSSTSQNRVQASAQSRQQTSSNSQQAAQVNSQRTQQSNSNQAAANSQRAQAQVTANQAGANTQQPSAQVSAQATQTALTAEEPGIPASQAAPGARWRAILPDLRGITLWFNNLDSGKVKSVLTVQNLGESVNICWNYKDYKNEISPNPNVEEVFQGSNCNQDYPPGATRPTVDHGQITTHSRRDASCGGYSYVSENDFRIQNRDTELPCLGSVVVYSADNTQPILPAGLWCVATRAPSNSHEQFMCLPMNFVKESELP